MKKRFQSFLPLFFVSLAALGLHFFVLLWFGKRLGFNLHGAANVASALNHLDVGWYLSIVQNGYVIDPSAAGQNAVFFPLFPYTAHLVYKFLQLSPMFSLHVVHVASLIFLSFSTAWFALELAKQKENAILGDPLKLSALHILGVLLLSLMLHPAGLFLHIPYTEALFLAILLCLSALLIKTTCANPELPTPSRFELLNFMGLGILAGLVRPTGLFLIPAFCMHAAFSVISQKNFAASGFSVRVLQEKISKNASVKIATAVSLGVGLGIFLFMGLLQVSIGEPFAFRTYRAAGWHEVPSMLNIVKLLWPELGGMSTFIDLFLLCSLAVSAAVWRFKTFRPLALFGLISILVPVFYGKHGDMIRYSIALVPGWFFFFMWLRRKPILLSIVVMLFSYQGLLLWQNWLERKWVG